MQNSQTIIIDNGSANIKAGLSTDTQPTAYFPSVVGRPKYDSIMIGCNMPDCYVGESAIAKRGVLRMNWPIQQGIINNWDDAIKLWHQCFYNQLRVDPQQFSLMLTQIPNNPKQNREKTTQIMFETYSAPQFYLANSAALPLYSLGKTTGTVLSMGDGVTFSAPVFDGSTMSYAANKNSINGKFLTDFMSEMISQIQPDLAKNELSKISKLMKEVSCISLNPQRESQRYLKNKQQQIEYILPDGSIISLQIQDWKCPQVLFNPVVAGKDEMSLPRTVFQSIQQCDTDLKNALYGNIVLSGGGTLFTNFQTRLSNELSEIQTLEKIPNRQINIIPPLNRSISTWIGGSILSNLSSFRSRWIKKQEYQQYGYQIVHRYCF